MIIKLKIKVHISKKMKLEKKLDMRPATGRFVVVVA